MNMVSAIKSCMHYSDSVTLSFGGKPLYFFYIPFNAIPGGSVVKNPTANAGDAGLVARLGGSPGEGKGNPLQYSGLESPMDRGAWWATVHGIVKSRT